MSTIPPERAGAAPPSPAERSAEGAGGASRTGVLGMRLFLLSLAILFAASLIGYLVVRVRAEAWIALFLLIYATLTHRVKVWFFKKYGGD